MKIKTYHSILFLLLCLVISAQDITLKEAFKDYYYIGTALNTAQITGKDSQSVSIIKEHFNSITPENILKWESVHPVRDKYYFEMPDKFVQFGIDNNMFIIGHTLVWHSQVPDWVFCDKDGQTISKEELLAEMKDHIFTVAGRYKDKINGWDVVNEAFESDGSMRKSRWLEIIGEEYFEKAFIYAHEAAPDAELYYNDYDMWKPEKAKAVAAFIKKLKDKGVKIDGVGMQGHWALDYPSKEELTESMQALTDIGVKIMITELDLSMLPNPFNYTGADISTNAELREELNPYPEFLPDSMQIKQSARFVEFFNIFNQFKDNVSRVTFWGLTDGQTWRNDWPVHGRTDYPLLFDRKFQPKPAYKAIIKTVMDK